MKKTAIVKSFSALGAFLLVGATAFAAVGESGAGPDWIDLLLKTANFAILFFIVYRFGKKPFLNFVSGSLQQRSQSYLDADKREKDANERIAEFKQKYTQLENDLERYKSESAREMQAEKERILNETRQIIENLEEQTEQSYRTRTTHYREELVRYIAKETVREVVSHLKTNPGEINSEALADKFLEQLKSSQKI